MRVHKTSVFFLPYAYMQLLNFCALCKALRKLKKNNNNIKVIFQTLMTLKFECVETLHKCRFI